MDLNRLNRKLKSSKPGVTRSNLRAALNSLENEEYAAKNLPYHLLEANMIGELKKLMSDQDFLSLSSRHGIEWSKYPEITQAIEPKLCFIDKDGTLVKPRSGGIFVQSPTDQELIEGAKERVEQMVDDGWDLVIVSNQGGCAAINPQTGNPYKTIDQTVEEMRFVLNLLPEIKFALFCPDFNGKQCVYVSRSKVDKNFEIVGIDCKYRMPDPGMLQRVMMIKQTDPQTCLMVGDRFEDEEAAKAASVNFIHTDNWLAGNMLKTVIGWIDGEPILAEEYGTMEGEFDDDESQPYYVKTEFDEVDDDESY